MQVIKVETTPVVLPLPQPISSALGKIRCFGCVLVQVHTDQGIVGENLVFTLNNVHTAVLREMIEGLAPLIIGCDPEHTAAFWSKAWTGINFLGHKGVSVVGISAIDGALWDIVGKASNRPLYRLLGGARDAVPAYHSGGLWLSRSTAELVEEAGLYVSQGFRAIKMRLGSATHRQDIERVRAGPVAAAARALATGPSRQTAHPLTQTRTRSWKSDGSRISSAWWTPTISRVRRSCASPRSLHSAGASRASRSGSARRCSTAARSRSA